MAIRQAKYKVWSEYDCYTYLVFVDLDDDIKLGRSKTYRNKNFKSIINSNLTQPANKFVTISKLFTSVNENSIFCNSI